MDKVILTSKNIKIIEQTFSDFVNDAITQIETDKNEISYIKYENSIPLDFKTQFEENPVATIRLFSSWEYVNQIGPLPASNMKNYVRGDKHNVRFKLYQKQ